MTTSTRPNLPRALARRQHWLVTRDQLRRRGWSRAAIRHALAIGELHLVYDGVYAVGRPDLDVHGQWLAAVLAAGPGAALSHSPGALLRGFFKHGDRRPHVTVPSHNGRKSSRPGYTLHRSRILSPDDTDVIQGITVTSAERTLWDLCGTRDAHRVPAAMREAVRTRQVELPALHASVAGRMDRRSGRLLKVLGLYVPKEELTESELEARFLRLCHLAGFPPPDLQYRFGRRRADFAWHDCRLVVETDGRDHLTIVALNHDHAKDRALLLDGYTVLRFTWADVVNRPAQTVRELQAHRSRLLRGAAAA